MTLDDLTQVFDAAWDRCPVSDCLDADGQVATYTRAGVTAVVMALLNEMGFDYNECGDCTRNDRLFDEILGTVAGAGDVAAGASTGNPEGGIPFANTSPAAACCQWDKSKICPSCGKPIKFTDPYVSGP